MVQMTYDATQFEPSTGGQDVFETGEWLFQITNSELKETQKKDGRMIVFTATCMEEGQAGKKLLIRLNVQNPSAQAVEIAMRDLSAISHVCGVLQWSDTQQLHGRPFRIKLEKTTFENKEGKQVPTNDIKGYLDVHGNPPGQGGGAAAAGAPAAPPAPPAAPAAPAAPAPAAAPPAPPAAPAAPAPAAAPPAPAAAAAPAPVQPDPNAAAPVAPAAPAAPPAPAAPAAPPAAVGGSAPAAPTPPWPGAAAS